MVKLILPVLLVFIATPAKYVLPVLSKNVVPKNGEVSYKASNSVTKNRCIPCIIAAVTAATAIAATSVASGKKKALGDTIDKEISDITSKLERITDYLIEYVDKEVDELDDDFSRKLDEFQNQGKALIPTFPDTRESNEKRTIFKKILDRIFQFRIQN